MSENTAQQTEQSSGLERRITFTVPTEDLEKAVDERLRELGRNVRLPGFRQGRVPARVLRQRYGKQVRAEALEELVRNQFYRAVAEERLRPAGGPVLSEPEEGEGGLTFTATFEVYPEIELQSLEGVTIEKPVVEITDADVDKVIQRLREQQAEWQAVDRPAKEGDRVTVDYKATIEGEPFEGGEGEDLVVELGAGRMIDGFEEGLVGAKPGDTVEMDLTFPENYGKEDLAGKPAHFTVTVKKVEEPVLPELDDEFARRYGIEEGGIEALRREVRENMARELDRTLRQKVKEQVMDALLEKHDVPVPEALVREESERLARQMQAQMGAQGQALQLPLELFEKEARKRVALGLILAELVKQNGIKADQEKVKEALEELTASYEHPEEVMQWYLSQPERLAEIESMVVENEIVDRLLEQAEVQERPASFDEIMNPDQSSGSETEA